MTLRRGSTTSMVVLGVFIVAACAVCVRLGIWQLDRLAQRRAYNAQVAARLDQGTEPLRDAFARDTADARWRHVVGTGVALYDQEVVLSARTFSGSPGVWLVTPLSLEGTDTLVALVRGWVYSANGRTINFANWRESDTIAVDGRLDEFQRPSRGAPRSPTDARAFRWLERDTLAAEWGAPVAPMLVYQFGDTIGGYEQTGGVTPARFPVPTMDEGPHKSYAFQWFSFSIVFLVGYVAVVVSSRRKAQRVTAARSQETASLP